MTISTSVSRRRFTEKFQVKLTPEQNEKLEKKSAEQSATKSELIRGFIESL